MRRKRVYQPLKVNYLHTAVWLSVLFAGNLMLTAAVKWLAPNAIPFDLLQFWYARGNWYEWLLASWPILLWAVGVTILVSMLTTNGRTENHHAEGLFLRGTLVSLWAGVIEELNYRWVIFFTSIVLVKILNFFFFGFAGFGVLETLYVHVSGPVADFFTLGKLHSVIGDTTTWAAGAGLLTANGFFRDGHKYQGWIGWINSWFIGMFMFWLLFEYGLTACILVHFVYDFFIEVIRYADRCIERAKEITARQNEKKFFTLVMVSASVFCRNLVSANR